MFVAHVDQLEKPGGTCLLGGVYPNSSMIKIWACSAAADARPSYLLSGLFQLLDEMICMVESDFIVGCNGGSPEANGQMSFPGSRGTKKDDVLGLLEPLQLR